MFFTIKKRTRRHVLLTSCFVLRALQICITKCHTINVAEITRNQAITHAIHYKSDSEDWNEKCTTALFLFRF